MNHKIIISEKTKNYKGSPETHYKEWSDSDGNGRIQKFSSKYSKLCIVDCSNGIQIAKYDGKLNEWTNFATEIDNVEWWIELEFS